MYCDDSKTTHVDAKEVVVSLLYHLFPFRAHNLFYQGKPAYIIYYKRVKT